MSYDLRVWEPPSDQPLPASLQEAMHTMLALEQREPGPNPKFAALAAQMAELADHGHVQWVGDPVAGAARCSRAVWSFALPDEDRVHLLCTVVKMANALGLVVLDDQLGLVLVPPDGVLPPERAAQWKSAMQHAEEDARQQGRQVPLSSTLAAARDAMKAALTTMLGPLGFMSPRKMLGGAYYHGTVEGMYFRSTPAGGQSLELITSVTNDVPCLTIDVNVFSNEIADILRVVFPENDEQYIRRQLHFHVGVFAGVYAYLPVRTPGELQRVVAEVRDPVVPILEMTRTALGMQAVMGGATAFALPNHPYDLKTFAEHTQQELGFGALVSAWRYGGDQFPALVEKKREAELRWWRTVEGENKAQRLERLLAYLRDHVKRDG